MFKNNKSFNSITVNGKTIQCSGNNICINNGQIIVDGNIVQTNMYNNVKVIINGSVNKIECTGSVEVDGECGSIDCGGSVDINGNVNGNIDCGGSCTCGNVSGDIDAGGSVSCKR